MHSHAWPQLGNHSSAAVHHDLGEFRYPKRLASFLFDFSFVGNNALFDDDFFRCYPRNDDLLMTGRRRSRDVHAPGLETTWASQSRCHKADQRKRRPVFYLLSLKIRICFGFPWHDVVWRRRRHLDFGFPAVISCRPEVRIKPEAQRVRRLLRLLP